MGDAGPRSPPRLHIITDPALGDALVDQVEAALAGVGKAGPAVAVHLRAKAWQTATLLRVGKALRASTRRAGARLLVNTRVDVAERLDADGVHLPAAAGTRQGTAVQATTTQAAAVQAVRGRLGPTCLVGVSCHSRDDLVRAAAAGADYAFLSPVFAVVGKAPALGVAGFGALAANSPLPTMALGGVGPDHVGALRAAGATGVACIRAVMGAPHPDAVVSAYLAALH